MNVIAARIIGTEQIQKKLNKLWKEDLEKARTRWLKEATILIEWEAKIQAPVDKWILRKYIRSKVSGDQWLVYNNVAYAIFVHEWTKPHEIVIHPKEKKALFRKGAEHPFKKTVVHHPWTKANPFFTRAVDNKKSEVLQRFEAIVESFMNKD